LEAVNLGTIFFLPDAVWYITLLFMDQVRLQLASRGLVAKDINWQSDWDGYQLFSSVNP